MISMKIYILSTFICKIFILAAQNIELGFVIRLSEGGYRKYI